MTVEASLIPSDDASFIEFGHQFASVDAYWNRYFNVSCSTNDCSYLLLNYEIGHTPLCFVDMRAFNTTSQFSLRNFGADNGSVSYLPCDVFATDDFPETGFPDVTPTHTFSESGGFLLKAFLCNVQDNDTYDNATQLVVKQQTRCDVQCNTSVACFGSHFYFNATEGSTLACTEKFACAFTFMYSLSPVFAVLCSAEASCRGALVLVDADVFQLDCVAKDSCSEMQLDLTIASSASIVCFAASACDQLTVYSNSDNISVTQYNGNQAVHIVTPTGFIDGQLMCDPGDAYMSVSGDAFTSLQDSSYALFGGSLPCESTTFGCTDVDGACSMTYDFGETPQLDAFESFMQCFGPFYLSEVSSLRCAGSCPSSPTSSPTNSPSAAPTLPSQSPTTSPTVAPTDSPSFSPTAAPSASPSPGPTENPTRDPTADPTLLPTGNPSLRPSVDPTASPTRDPTQ